MAKLLAPCLQTGITADFLYGNEPRELIRESYRMRRRARIIAAPANEDAGQESGADIGQSGQPPLAHKAFRDWHRSRHHEAPKGIARTAETIISDWGPGVPLDEQSFYACSPFRVAMTAHLIMEGFEPGYASRAIRLLPEWTQWCAQKSGIPDNLAAPSIAAARSAVDTLDTPDAEKLPSPQTPRRSATRNGARSQAANTAELGSRPLPVPLDPASWQVLQRCLVNTLDPKLVAEARNLIDAGNRVAFFAASIG
ncbi:MAG: hypothetical protein ACRDNS_15800, partial [Trebonia sp.]